MAIPVKPLTGCEGQALLTQEYPTVDVEDVGATVPDVSTSVSAQAVMALTTPGE